MAINLSSMSSTLMPNAAAKFAELARTNPMHYTANGVAGLLDDASGEGSGASAGGASFQDALLKAMDGVSSSQTKRPEFRGRAGRYHSHGRGEYVAQPGQDDPVAHSDRVEGRDKYSLGRVRIRRVRTGARKGYGILGEGGRRHLKAGRKPRAGGGHERVF
jgi:hypothetical protein